LRCFGPTVAAEVASGRLTCLDVEGLPIVRRWFVINRASRALSPTARAFRDFAVNPEREVSAKS
jgi:LysR family transcriptional regulator, low CO2-responsive transcriptional regulator